MKITKDIQNAIRKASEELGHQNTLAKKAGISEVYISRYLSGKNQSCTDETWEKLYPYIRKYLPEPIQNNDLTPDEEMILEAYRSFSKEEKSAAIREFAVKAEMKKARKTG